ncbi:trypsin-like peptidase domain-containing protein [Streptomyces ferralitis]|uniref:Trypsin-like peptidase domain-containing protein n=2 Tax=Streptantibioticus ferralitis TaxID=236510 RepID=A0ABT5Z0K6_9ACTN|nr:trypsin-like peptidase domain-containing protein [Streptantibioticus ferralitis]MDF2257376.1 trypsin-like peptidase domain-containing protein [Streptantibioticus ferralitis]
MEGEPGVSEQPRDTAQMPPVPPAHPTVPPPPVPPSAFSAPAPGTPGQPADPPQPPNGPQDPYGSYALSPAPAPEQRRRPGAGGLVAAVIVAALVAGGVGGGIGYWAANRADNGSTTVSSAVDPKALNRPPSSVAGIANRALPSVVTINASGSQESGTGTGFVYDTQGHILTNNHVVAPAANGGKLTVTFSNGKTYDAEVVGRAQGYDIAVIKLKNAGDAKLNPLPVGNSDQAAVGDATIAIGAPFGLSGTVTTGIVSAKNRPVASSDGQGSTASYMSALQTDASINPGNSGGPLLNANGAVIGVNSAIQSANNGASSPFGGSSQAGSIGLGFAIPINEAKYVADTLIKTGQPVYAVMGLSVNMNYNGQGAQISDNGANGGSAVTAGGPGDKAGLKPGDVITKLNDTVVDSGPTLIGTIWQHRPGDQAQVTYQRGGSTHTTTVTLGERKGDS